MKRTLLVMRHGNAHQQFGQSDLDRDISEIGKREIASVVRQVNDKDLTIDFVLVSPVKRAQQTFQFFQEYMEVKFPSETTPALHYNSDVSNLFDELLAYDQPTILLIGHQPLLGDFIYSSCNKKQMIDVPTASITCLTFENEIKQKNAEKLWQILPQD